MQEQGRTHIGRRRIDMLDGARPEAACHERHARVGRHYHTVVGAIYVPDSKVVTVEATEPGAELTPRPDAILYELPERTR